MKKTLFLILLSIFSAIAAVAQTGKVTGTLLDASNGEYIPGAVVEYASVKSPDRKKYVTTGFEGAISIPSVSYGDYRIVISFLGYEKLEKEIRVNAPKVDIGRLNMKPSSEQIESVVKEVQAMRTSQKGDTVSYNAGAFKVAGDADVEGLLKKMPGITITDGEVEAQGETVKKVFVDGKEFFGEDVTTAIQSLPAQAVDRVEVYNKLSDQAEFSGMDDGEGYKAINIVTHKQMRQGQFGKVYAGYGYDNNDNALDRHKYMAGGNVNLFQGDSRVSLLGLFNNINRQNFSFEDILDVSGSTGGRHGVGQYMVRPQKGVATVNAIGLNYSDSWGKRDQVTFQGSYFFNNSSTTNHSTTEKYYEAPSPLDTLMQRGYSNTVNNNHRLNARVEWKISDNQSLMSRTGVSFQLNNPLSTTNGVQYGESGYSIIDNYGKTRNHGYNLNEFLQYRAKLGKAGRTITVDGNAQYNNRDYTRRSYSNTAEPYEYDPAVPADTLDNGVVTRRYLFTLTPSTSYNVRANFTYTEPLSKYSQFSMQYRFNLSHSENDKKSYVTDADYSYAGLTPDPELSSDYRSDYTTHRAGPGFRFSKNRNTIVANVYYQRAELSGQVLSASDQKIGKSFDNATYFFMTHWNFDRQNSIRLFVRSSTDNPSVTQLQQIKDISNAQYVSSGNAKLDQSYSHNVRMHYINSNVTKGRTFMWMFSLTATQDYIGRSIYYNPSYDITGLNYVPLQYSTYENMDGYFSLRTHVSYGTPINFIKCNLNLRAGVTYGKTPSMIDGQRNNAGSMNYDFGAVLGSNVSENVDFTLSWNGTYSEATNSLSDTRNRYFSQSASASLKATFWKGFTFTGSCAYTQYLGFTNDYNDDYFLCNVFLGKKIFRNRRGEIQIGVNDLLNQNSSFTRTTGSGYVQNQWNNVIGRYYTIQFTYNLRHFGKKGSKDIKDYDGMDRGSGGRRHGMPPMGPPPGGGFGGPR